MSPLDTLVAVAHRSEERARRGLLPDPATECMERLLRAVLREAGGGGERRRVRCGRRARAVASAVRWCLRRMDAATYGSPRARRAYVRRLHAFGRVLDALTREFMIQRYPPPGLTDTRLEYRVVGSGTGAP
jgi:hypothetical protein